MRLATLAVPNIDMVNGCPSQARMDGGEDPHDGDEYGRVNAGLIRSSGHWIERSMDKA